MAKKITLKNKNGDVLCPHTAIEQVQGLKAALDGKLGKTEKAASASKLNTSNMSVSDVNNCSNSEGVIEYHSMIPNTTANIPAYFGYQNAVMSFGLLNNGATAQMFFSKDRPLYYRSSQTAEWQQIAYKSDVDDKLGKTEKAASAKATKVSKASEVDPNAALSFYAGQAAPSTTPTADKVYVGSSADGSIISVPALDGSTSMANYMNLRMSFNSKFFHEIAVSPNSNGIYHRNVRNGNALEWKQLAYKNDVDNIEIGGRNLALNSDVSASNASYLLYSCSLSEALVQGETYTFTVWGTLGSDRDNFNLFESVGGVHQGEVKQVSDGKYSLTFKYNRHSNSDDKILRFYQMPSTGTSTSTVQKVKVERGNKATDWSPAPEDVQAKIDGKLGKTEKAASATKADSASYANATREPNNHTYSTRRTTANVHYNADGGLHYFLATGSITDNSAPEGHIIHCDWDNDPNSWLAQLLIKHGSNNGLLRRYKQYSTDSWSEWITMLDDKNFDKYALPLTGGTLTGDLTATNFIGNLQGVADVATTLYDDDSGTYKKWKDIDTAITSKIGDQFEDYATKEYVDDEITSRITGVTPSNATETGAGIVRAATQVEVLDGHVNDNDPDEMAFVRPETLQAKLDDYVKNGEANFTGPVNITGTDSTQSKLTFARSLSYISNSGKIGIVPNGQTLSNGYGVWFSNTGIEPGIYVGNTYNLGSSSYKWKTVYATTFNGTATAVADGCVSTSKIADTAITSEKLAQNLILRGTPQLETQPTLSSESQNIASVGLVKKAVENIEIGGTNLLRYIKNDGSSYWESRGTCNVTITNEVIRCNANGSSYPRIMNASVKDVNWEPNAQYVLSYYARGEGEYARRVGIVDINAANGVLPLHTDGVYTSEWKKYVYSFTTPSVLPNIEALLLQIYCANIEKGDTTSWLEIKDIKLERGNKSTDWTPSPEDVEAKIEDAKPTIFLQTLQPSATEVKEGDIWIIQ